MTFGLALLYLAAVALGVFPVVRVARLRRVFGLPFLARFQPVVLLTSLIAFASLIIRYLGPGLNVTGPERSLNLGMLFGLILVPALIALCYFFIRLAFSLVQRPVFPGLTIGFAVFWGLFFCGFVLAEVLYFRTGSLSVTRVLEPVFSAALGVFLFGTILILFGLAGRLPDPGRRALARTLALAYLVGFTVPVIATAAHSRAVPRWMLAEYLFSLVFNVGVTALVEYRLRRHFAGLRPSKGERASGDIFARYRITRRERDVIREILAGRSNSEIAQAFFISEKTVETHIYSIYQKAGVKNRIQLLNLFRVDAGSRPDP